MTLPPIGTLDLDAPLLAIDQLAHAEFPRSADTEHNRAAVLAAPSHKGPQTNSGQPGPTTPVLASAP